MKDKSRGIRYPPVTREEVKKASDAIQRVKAAGVDQVTADLLKNSGHIVLVKLATLYTQCLMTLSMPESWMNANIILTHKTGDAKELKNNRPISLLSFAASFYKDNRQQNQDHFRLQSTS